MKSKWFWLQVLIMLLSVFVVTCFATYSTSNYNEQGGARTVIGGSLDVVSGGDLDVESGGALKIAGTAITSSAAELNYLDGASPGSFVANKVIILGAVDGNTGDALVTTGSGGVTWSAIAGTFTGGNITSDCNLSNGVDFLPGGHTAGNNYTFKVWDTSGAAALDALVLTAGTEGGTGSIALGNDLVSLSIASNGGLNATTAGIVTGITGLTATGPIYLDANSNNNVLINTGTSTGTTYIGGGLSSIAIDTSSWDVSSAGAFSGVTTLSLSDDITMATGKGVKGSQTNAETVGLYGYDTDGAWVGAVVITNGTTPATVLGNTNGTTAISSADWTIGTTGNAAGLGTITSNGLFTCTGGETMTGTVSINDSATTSTTSIAGGTTTGTLSLATGASAQSVNIATGAGAKTTTIGSTNTTSTTNIQSGSNGVNLNASVNNPVNIGTGTSTGTVTIGSATGAQAVTVQAGTGNLALSSVDDVTLNGGSSGSLINIGINTHGNVFHIGDNDTTADSGTIGSAKDTWALAGISVTVGSTGTTSATVIQSGSGEVKINESNNQPVSIGTGTCTGTVTIGGAGAQTINIGDGAAAKTVTLGSSNTTSTTTLSAGSGNINLVGNAVTSDNITGDGTSTLGGFMRTVTDSAEDKAVDAAESGTLITNAGAPDANTFTLPSAAAGLEYYFVVMAAHAMQIDPASGDVITINAVSADAGEYWSADAVGEWLHLIAVDTTNWIAVGYGGTWTQENP